MEEVLSEDADNMRYLLIIAAGCVHKHSIWRGVNTSIQVFKMAEPRIFCGSVG